MTSPNGVDDPEADAARRARVRRWLYVAVVVAVLLCLTAAVLHFRDEYNPFWESTAEARETQALAVATQARSLTEAEFARALELCERGHVQARADAISVVEESAKRSPERGRSAEPVMRRVVLTRYARAKAAAERLLKRIEADAK